VKVKRQTGRGTLYQKKSKEKQAVGNIQSGRIRIEHLFQRRPGGPLRVAWETVLIEGENMSKKAGHPVNNVRDLYSFNGGVGTK